jgi:hypothetical protein
MVIETLDRKTGKVLKTEKTEKTEAQCDGKLLTPFIEFLTRECKEDIWRKERKENSLTSS